jgi:hypothetical protein
LNITGTTSLGDNVSINNIISKDENMSFYDNSGNKRMVITNYLGYRGYVGMGTRTSPQAPLDVGTIGESAYIRISASSGVWDAAIRFGLEETIPWTIGVDDTPPDNFKISNFNTLGINDRLVITQGGSVGIGTSSPANTLNVVGDLNVTGTSYLGNMIIAADNITVNNLKSKDGNITFYDNSEDKNMVITDSGKVGIGTATPSETLSVGEALSALSLTGAKTISIGDSSHDVYLLMGNGNNNYGWLKWTVSDRSLSFKTMNSFTPYSDTLVIRDGKVGIGTSTPTHTLNVVGNANVTGDSYIGNSSSVSTIIGKLGIGFSGTPNARGLAIGAPGGTGDMLAVNNSGNVAVDATETTGIAIQGYANVVGGTGVKGIGYYGVYGQPLPSGSGWAGYFAGNVTITGNLTANHAFIMGAYALRLNDTTYPETSDGIVFGSISMNVTTGANGAWVISCRVDTGTPPTTVVQTVAATYVQSTGMGNSDTAFSFPVPYGQKWRCVTTYYSGRGNILYLRWVSI